MDDDPSREVGLMEMMPPGFRFHPTDVEVIYSYLREKVLNENFSPVAIGDVDLNKSEPWELPSMAKMEGKEHYFYSRKDKKYPTGSRTNRATFYGYWKATGKDKGIYNEDGDLVGMKKTLVFYNGRAPRGHKTNWVMHEFRLEGRSLHGLPILGRDSWVVCKVTHKDGSSTEPKHGAAMIGANITSAEENYNITNSNNNNNQLGVHPTGIFGTPNLPLLMNSSTTITATAAAAFSVINNQVQTQYMNTPPPMYIPTPTIGASRCFVDHSNQSQQMNGATSLLHGGGGIGGREPAPIIATSPAVSNLEETTDEGSENYQDPAGFDEINRLLFDDDNGLRNTLWPGPYY